MIQAGPKSDIFCLTIHERLLISFNSKYVKIFSRKSFVK
jgi:hypothetical protein